MDDMFEAGRQAALRIWADADDAPMIVDPRQSDFAKGVIAGLSAGLEATPGVMRKVVGHAAAAAEDLNVEAFQGLVEVLQNADDLNARSVRFALSTRDGQSSLLIVHDGRRGHITVAEHMPSAHRRQADSTPARMMASGEQNLRACAQNPKRLPHLVPPNRTSPMRGRTHALLSGGLAVR